LGLRREDTRARPARTTGGQSLRVRSAEISSLTCCGLVPYPSACARRQLNFKIIIFFYPRGEDNPHPTTVRRRSCTSLRCHSISTVCCPPLDLEASISRAAETDPSPGRRPNQAPGTLYVSASSLLWAAVGAAPQGAASPQRTFRRLTPQRCLGHPPTGPQRR
jgi:hypothetical protein